LPSRIFGAYLSIRACVVLACVAAEKCRLYSRWRPRVNASNAAFRVLVEAMLELLGEHQLRWRAHLQARLLDVDGLVDMCRHGLGQSRHVVGRGEAKAPCRS
jgi:hypothetical protein